MESTALVRVAVRREPPARPSKNPAAPALIRTPRDHRPRHAAAPAGALQTRDADRSAGGGGGARSGRLARAALAAVLTGGPVVPALAGDLELGPGNSPHTVSGTETYDNVAVGYGGTGTLRVTAGGSLSDGWAYIDANSSATVTGTDSRWTSNYELSIGKFNTGTGTLTVEAGGSVSDRTAFIGEGSGMTGSATVTGTNSRWTSTGDWNRRGDFFVGFSGTGTLAVADGGTVSAGTDGTATVFIARKAGSTGTLAIGAAAGDPAIAAGTIQAGTVTFGDGTGTLVFNHTGNPDGTAVTFAPTITGAGSLSHLAGTTVLTGANTYTGATTVSGGTLTLGNATALGAADGTAANGTNVASGATLALQGGIAVGNEALSIAGTGVNGGGALRNISGNNSYAGAITLTDTARIGSDSGTLTLSGAISGTAGANRDLTLGGAGDGVVSGAISGNIGGLTKDGAGTWTLTGASTLGRNVTIDGGALRLEAGGSVSGVAGFLGFAAGTSGTVTVAEAGSSWTNSSELYVGDSGTGTLTVQAGGQVSASDAYLGQPF